MNILVTGGAGFIGSRLIERLLRAHAERIVCVDDFNTYYDPAIKRANVAGLAAEPRVRIVEATCGDADAMAQLMAAEKITHVAHLGAYAGVRHSVENPQPYLHHNVCGTLAMLEAARRHGVDRFLLVSSSTVYGRNAVAPFVEDAPLGTPLSPYGVSKGSAELLGLMYAEQFRVPVVCLRPFSVYGPRLRPDLALSIFAESIVAGRALPLFGDGSIRRDFTYVDDICDGLTAALDRPGCVGEAINLGHDAPIPMRDVIAALAQALGKPARIEYLPECPGEMPITHADLTKARRLLGYVPRTEFRDGLRAFAAWFLSKRQTPNTER